MNIKKLIETQEILWQNMRDNGYCRDYLMSYNRELDLDRFEYFFNISAGKIFRIYIYIKKLNS